MYDAGPTAFFPSEGSHTQNFYALKYSLTPAGFEPETLEFSGEYENHWTTGVDFFGGVIVGK